MVETRTRTDQKGHFELSGLRPIVRSQGRRTLYYEHPGYGLAWRQAYSEYELTGRHDGQILIKLQPSVEFDGIVTDLDGRPADGATVAVSVSHSDNQNRQPRLATSYEGSLDLSAANDRADCGEVTSARLPKSGSRTSTSLPPGRSGRRSAPWSRRPA